MLGLAHARSPRTSESAPSPGEGADGERASTASSSYSPSAALPIVRRDAGAGRARSHCGASSASSSPGDRLTEAESFLLAWEADRAQIRDRLHERLY